MVPEPIDLDGHTNLVTYTIFSPDSRRLLSGSWDTTIKVWDVAQGIEEFTLRGHSNSIWSLSLTNDGQVLASGSGDFSVKTWSLASREELLTFSGHTEGVYSVGISGDGNILASASSDKTVRLWDPSTGQEIRRLDYVFPVRGLALSRTGDLLVTACGIKYIGQPPTNILSFWNPTTGEQLLSVTSEVSVDELVFSDDGKWLAVGLSEGEWDTNPPDVDGIVEIWDITSLKMFSRWHAHDAGVRSVALTSTGERVVTGSYDKIVKIWNVPDQSLHSEFPGQEHWIDGVAISADERWLASGGGQSPRTAELHLWDLYKLRK
jgi:WD40 repeat protein